LIRNAEVFGLFDFDADRDTGPHPMFAQCFDLATQLASNSSTAVRRQLHKVPGLGSYFAAVPDGPVAPKISNSLRERLRV
jgi:hypothetical protein